MSTDPMPDWTAIIAERKIKEAMDEGKFDNLPGKGKPINLDENPGENAGQRIFNRILKDSGALPEWAELAREIEKEIAAIEPSRERGLRTIRNAKNEPSRHIAAERLRESHKERMRIINNLVLKYNYTVPAGVQRAFRTFKIKDEMERLEADITESMSI